MNKPSHSCRFHLEPEDQGRLLNLCGQLNSHLHRLEKAFEVYIYVRGHHISISGENAESLELARQTIAYLYRKTSDIRLNDEIIELTILETDESTKSAPLPSIEADTTKASISYLEIGKISIKLRSKNQLEYAQSIRDNGVTVGIGPAGTGKTYLAVACAAEALQRRRIERIVLVRPAVEAGEKLGFLPGDLQQKVDPYLRPMFDSLHEFFGEEDTNRKLKHGKIEIASLAYMRGRTLSHSFVVMDEAQNATHNQMLMLLTRIGVDSTLVVNGDISQIDLPGRHSGLVEAIDILKGVRDVKLVFFDDGDIQRSRLVRDIVRAYQRYDERKATQD